MIKISIILLCAVLLISLISIFSLSPKLKLDKEKETINVFDNYEDISYYASSLGKDITDKVIKDGTVDTEHVGKYTITYTVKNSFFKTTKTLEVEVVDTVAPELNLNGGNEYNVCSLSSYVDPGYSAVDNYDGDITDKVEKNNISEDEIEYKVSDSSNNTSTINRKLIVGDNSKPEIKLKGNDTVYVVKGSKYEESGATASDNCDGDLTKGISIEGNVNTKKNGTYEVKYSVKDSNGNENTVVRKVIVQNKKQSTNTNNNESTNNEINTNTSGVIYLTFDDGPGSYTNKILDILNKYGIKATFFVTMAGSNDVLRREFDEGHTIGLHTATHNYKQIYASVDSYFEDLNTVSNRVLNVTGKSSKYIRFPGGTSNRVSAVGMSNLVREVDARGYKYFDWNVSVEDAGACAYKKDKGGCVIEYFKTYLRPNRENTVLMHDIKSYTADSLETMIKYAKDRGYTFKQIDDTTTPVHLKPHS